jgi:DNA helicase HerA-like ATPase
VDRILIGKGDVPVYLLGRYGNRHGLVAGATGTGKTVSLLVMAEGFSRMGVPVFMTDVKGDVAGLAMPGLMTEHIKERASRVGLDDYRCEASPVIFWDCFGSSGHPMRTTVSEVGPALLGRILNLNDTQEGMLEIAFRVADEQGLLLLDLDDLRAMLAFLSENRHEISSQYGLVSGQSVSAVQRALLTLEREGGKALFGEPALELRDLMRTDLGGRGIISILSSERLITNPRVYSSLLLWLVSELFENLPELGDRDVPRLAVFFDEAHLLFQDTPSTLREKVEQVVRLIRSKGVGLYFCSQFPDDLPREILGQMGNRIQHALRAYTPRDQKAVRSAAETFVPNPRLDISRVISELAVGEALVSTLQDRGIPMPVERALISPPRCRIGPLTDQERDLVRSRSPIAGKYDIPLNRESAYEILTSRTLARAKGDPSSAKRTDSAEGRGKIGELLWGTGKRQGMVEAMAKQAARSIGSSIGRRILRGLLGGILGGSGRR